MNTFMAEEKHCHMEIYSLENNPDENKCPVSLCCSVLDFIKSFPSFSEFFTHHEKFFDSRILLGVFTNQENNILH